MFVKENPDRKKKKKKKKKEIKSLISLKPVASSVPTIPSLSHSLSPSLSLSPSSAIFLEPADRKEIANMVSSLNFYKAFGPNSVPYRILFFVENKILKQLGNLFSLNLMTCFFPSVFKTGKAVPVFKKDSKLDYSNYYPISLLSNIEKILKILCIKDYIPFSIKVMVSITHSLDSDNSILHIMP